MPLRQPGTTRAIHRRGRRVRCRTAWREHERTSHAGAHGKARARHCGRCSRPMHMCGEPRPSPVRPRGVESHDSCVVFVSPTTSSPTNSASIASRFQRAGKKRDVPIFPFANKTHQSLQGRRHEVTARRAVAAEKWVLYSEVFCETVSAFSLSPALVVAALGVWGYQRISDQRALAKQAAEIAAHREAQSAAAPAPAAPVGSARERMSQGCSRRDQAPAEPLTAVLTASAAAARRT